MRGGRTWASVGRTWGRPVLSLCFCVLSVNASAGDEPASEPRAKAAPAPGPKRAQIEDFAPSDEFVMVGPVKTHVVRKGDLGPAVVLVHGFGASTYTWNKTIDALSQDYRVFAVDMKGFGLTAKPKDGEYHPRAFADHLLAFLDAMKIDRAVLVGHSLGGAVVTRLALRNPARVLGLVLVAPAPVGMTKGRPGGVSAVPKVPPPEERADAVGAAKPAMKDISVGPAPALAVRLAPLLLRTTITRQTVESGLKTAFHDPALVTPEMVEAYYRPITIEGGAEALAAMMNPPPSAADGPLPPLTSLKVPTLIAVGGHDRMVPPAVAESYAGQIPGAEQAAFPRSGHVPHEEEAAAFNARLRDFLRRIPKD